MHVVNKSWFLVFFVGSVEVNGNVALQLSLSAQTWYISILFFHLFLTFINLSAIQIIVQK